MHKHRSFSTDGSMLVTDSSSSSLQPSCYSNHTRLAALENEGWLSGHNENEKIKQCQALTSLKNTLNEAAEPGHYQNLSVLGGHIVYFS